MSANCIAVTMFDDVHAKSCREYRWQFDELAEWLRAPMTYPNKASCPLLKMASFGAQRTEAGCLRHDQNVLEIFGVEGDYDGGEVSLADAQILLAEKGISAVLYTSPSNTEANPRWRVLVPLSRPYPPGERARFVAKLNGALGGILAPESFNLSQAFFCGRVEGGFYAVAQIRGKCIDDLPDLAEIYPLKTGKTRAERLDNVRSTDPMIARLKQRELLLRTRTDGGADLICPFEADHTTPRTTGDCTYFPPHTGTFAHAHFHCLHSHCATRSDDDFLRALGIEDKRYTGNGNAPSSASDELTIERLANLSTLDYDRAREAEAERMGVRVSVLDRLVNARRKDAEEKYAGGAVDMKDVEPWPEIVNGSALLSEIETTITRYCILQEHMAPAVALWIVFTYAIAHVSVAPILAITSPEKGCGKTTLLTLLLRLVRRPLIASNISPSAVFRAIEKWEPTLLVDEADTFLTGNEELRGVINSGHARDSAFVVRCDGEDFEPRRFSTWGAKAIASIGQLAETLADRSIPIQQRRKLPGESVEKLRHADNTVFERITRQCVRFIADNAKKIKEAKPALLESLPDRTADNWEPLIAIADIAGGDWPKKSRTAAQALSNANADHISIRVEMLKDIQGVFNKGKDRLATADLIAELCTDDDKRWKTYNKGQPINARQVAKLIKDFKIQTNKNVRDGDNTFKGYKLEEFKDAFARYLPSHSQRTPENESQSVTQSHYKPGAASSHAATRHIQSVTDVTDSKIEPMTNTSVTSKIRPGAASSDVFRNVTRVTDKNGGIEGQQVNGTEAKPFETAGTTGTPFQGYGQTTEVADDDDVEWF